MTNSEAAKAATGAVVAATAAAASYIDQIEQWSRIIASWVSIAASIVVIGFAVSKKLKSKREKNHRKT